MKLKEFYGSKIGKNILNQECFPEEVSDYLKKEKLFLDNLVDKFDSIIEIGCGNGTHLQWAIENGKKYIGIDINEGRITKARLTANLNGFDSNQFKFACEKAENFPRVLDNLNIEQSNSIPFVYFPFNVFGNIESVEEIILSLKKTNIDFGICAFKTSNLANKIREKYYENCGCQNILRINDNKGVRFKSKEGLNTIAYFSDWMQRKFSSIKIKLKTYEISEIGIAYVSDKSIK